MSSLTLEDLLLNKEDPTLPELPDLGTLGSHSTEFVDLEFLDLATLPPERNKNKNPTLGYHFPDIFIDSTSSLFNTSSFTSNLLSEDIQNLTAPLTFKDNALDLDGVEKGLLADLFPPPTSGTDDGPSGELVDDFTDKSSESSAQKSSGETTGHVPNDGVYTVPMDVLQIISKNFSHLQTEFESTGPDSSKPSDELFVEEPPAVRKILRIKSIKTTPGEAPPPDGAVGKISIQTDKERNTTVLTILSMTTNQGHTFQVNTSNLSKATEALRPLNLDKLTFLRDFLPHSTHPTSPAAAPRSEVIELQEGAKEEEVEVCVKKKRSDLEAVEAVSLEKDQRTFDALAQHGIHIDSLKCLKTSTGKYWVCPHDNCKKAFVKQSILKYHLLKHYNIKPFECSFPYCTWSFPSAFKLRRHMESHNKEKNFSCSVEGCNRKFSTIYNLNTHLRLHERPAKFACPHCPESFQLETARETHLKTNHSESLGVHQCPQCDRRFHHNSDLVKHSRSHFRTELKNTCDVCDKSFKKPCELKTHMRVHTGIKPFACPVDGCTWAFRTKSKLSRHRKTHGQDRQHHCEECGKTYLRAEHLRAHVLTHSKAKNFACPFDWCGGRFSARSTLFVHVRKHKEMGEDETTGKTRRSLRCLVGRCEKKYNRSRDLTRHMNEEHPSLIGLESEVPAPDPNQFDFIALLSSVNDEEPREDVMLPVTFTTSAVPPVTTGNIIEVIPEASILDETQKLIVTMDGVNEIVLNENQCEEGLVATDHVVDLESKKELMTVDTSAITPVKNLDFNAATIPGCNVEAPEGSARTDAKFTRHIIEKSKHRMASSVRKRTAAVSNLNQITQSPDVAHTVYIQTETTAQGNDVTLTLEPEAVFIDAASIPSQVSTKTQSTINLQDLA